MYFHSARGLRTILGHPDSLGDDGHRDIAEPGIDLAEQHGAAADGGWEEFAEEQ